MDPNDSHANVPEATLELLRGARLAPARKTGRQLREEWARRITEAQLLTARSKEEEIFRRGHVDLRQLRSTSSRPASVESAAGLRAQPVRAHHSARRRDETKSSGSCYCWRDVLRALPVQEVPREDFAAVETRPSRARNEPCSEPHRP